MPFESRLFVKTALIALVVTFVWGAVMALDESFARSINPIWGIEHAHVNATASAIARAILGASAVAQVLAILLFVSLAWLRTRPPSRPAPGVR